MGRIQAKETYEDQVEQEVARRENREQASGVTWVCEVPKSYTIYRVTGLAVKHWSLNPLTIQLELDQPDEETLPREAESDLSSDSSSDDAIGNGSRVRTGKPAQTQRNTQILTPLIRSLETWVEGSEAVIWVRKTPETPSSG